ncbi:uncharacterized protein LOC131612155 [Vicia villosa]|uniref:uncharacterized protein LOC131612155 n=1 Tax=Vicia villosa TaxID=3911 RepID=UPI00273C4183|nr:uncharacterized protein LOC131612155 [Vicia villosa]
MAEKSVHLPQDLIIEILLRLPVKNVLCCKCVRKYSEILLIDFNASLNNESSYASPSHDFLPPESPLQIGSIHWMVCNYKLSTDVYCDVIIAFDLKESRMSEMALPYCFNYKDYPSNHNLLVLGGLISASTVGMHTVKIWVMKEYAVYSSWTKILEFFVDPALHNSLSIVCFTNRGDIIGRDDEGGLMKFNDKGHLLEHYSSPKGIDPRGFQMAVYTESLFSFPCGIQQV